MGFHKVWTVIMWTIIFEIKTASSLEQPSHLSATPASAVTERLMQRHLNITPESADQITMIKSVQMAKNGSFLP